VQLLAERIHFARVRETDAFSRWLGRAATPGDHDAHGALLEWQAAHLVLHRLMEMLHLEVTTRTAGTLHPIKPIAALPSGQRGPKGAEGVGAADRAEKARGARKEEFH
jgi:hypothetical protein